MKIVVFGGHGLLGNELQKLNSEIKCPIKEHVNIRFKHEIMSYIEAHKPNIIINAAAILDDKILKYSPEEAISTNIIGTANVANQCILNNIRLIYISTDYIYKGDKGNYSEEDEILPFNFYSWTKLGGECAIKGVKNHLIIRTTFGPSKFPYKQAFSDAYRSKDYVDVIAPMIYEAAISDLQGVINIGTERKSMYEYAKQRNPDVLPVKVKDSGFDAPYDTSFNIDKWKNYKNGK